MTDEKLSPEEVFEGLPDSLRLKLGAAYGSDDAYIEEMIGECDYELRAMLIDYKVIIAISPHDRPTTKPGAVGLTELGRQVVLECAINLTGSDRDAVQRHFEEVEERRVQSHEQAADQAIKALRRA